MADRPDSPDSPDPPDAPDSSGSPGWPSDRTGLTALALVSVALATLILLPYLQYVLLGIVLAYVLMPAQRRLERVTSSIVAALALVAVAILVILLPVLYVLAIALREALELLSAVQEGTLDMGDIERRLEATGYVVDISELYGAYQEQLGTIAQGLATSGIELVTGLPGLLIGLTVTVFVLFALLNDGARLVAWSRRVLPLEDTIQRELLAELDQLMWASLVGNVAVAAIQAIALGVGLAILGVPAVVFLTVATFVLALLPLIGAFGVWVPVALYLVAVGEPVGAAALVVYGSIVSASDTYLRPALIGRTSAFNSAIVVVGIFGGIVVFGAVGLFIGPVVLGGAKVTLDAFARERDRANGLETGTDDAAIDTESDTGIITDAVLEETSPEDGDEDSDEGRGGNTGDSGDAVRTDSSESDGETDSRVDGTTGDTGGADDETGPSEGSTGDGSNTDPAP